MEIKYSIRSLTRNELKSTRINVRLIFPQMAQFIRAKRSDRILSLRKFLHFETLMPGGLLNIFPQSLVRCVLVHVCVYFEATQK